MVARTKSKFIEPSDLPSPEREAIKIFQDAGWNTDAQWLAPLTLKFLGTCQASDDDLDFCTENNLKTIARSLADAGGLERRDEALTMVLARLCRCGGQNAALWLPPQPINALQQASVPQSLDDWRMLAEALRQRGACIERGLANGRWPVTPGDEAAFGEQLKWFAHDGQRAGHVPEPILLMRGLVDGANLDLTKVIDEGALVARGNLYMKPGSASDLQRRTPEPINRSSDPSGSPNDPLTWLIALGPRALGNILPVWMARKNDAHGAAMALGIRNAIECWLMHRRHHWTYFREAGRELAEACQPYLTELTRRCTTDGAPVDPDLRRAWLWYVWCVFEADSNLWNKLEPTAKKAVLGAATADIASLRKLFARATSKPVIDPVARDLIDKAAMRRGTRSELCELGPEQLCNGQGHLLRPQQVGEEWQKNRAPWEEFEWERDHLQTCLILLFQRAGVWHGLKPMLLALRALAAPAVAPDLRYWHEPDMEPIPEPWCTVLAWPINLFHAYVGTEQRSDPELLSLRSQFASFCLERLVDRWGKAERDQARRDGRQRTREDMIERSPDWRYAYVRAVSVLGVNPEGKGHRVLNAVAEIDPDPDVREAAKKAYEQLRRGVGLPDGASPRRAVMSALWWLRQGHLSGLEIKSDVDGAQRTRVKELTRTKEAEQAIRPATRSQANS